MESAIANEEAIGESRGARKAPTENRNLTAGGHELPRDWLVRIVLIWSGYAVSMFAGNAASYAGIWYVSEATGSPSTSASIPSQPRHDQLGMASLPRQVALYVRLSMMFTGRT